MEIDEKLPLDEVSEFLVSVKDASKLAHMKEQTVRSMLCKGSLSTYKIGGKTLIDKRELNDLLVKK